MHSLKNREKWTGVWLREEKGPILARFSLQSPKINENWHQKSTQTPVHFFHPLFCHSWLSLSFKISRWVEVHSRLWCVQSRGQHQTENGKRETENTVYWTYFSLYSHNKDFKERKKNMFVSQLPRNPVKVLPSQMVLFGRRMTQKSF